MRRMVWNMIENDRVNRMNREARRVEEANIMIMVKLKMEKGAYIQWRADLENETTSAGDCFRK